MQIRIKIYDTFLGVIVIKTLFIVFIILHIILIHIQVVPQSYEDVNS